MEALWDKAFMASHKLGAVTFHGCVFGLQARNGLLLKKPWRLASNSPEFLAAFRGCTCNGQHADAECRGRGAKISELYNPRIAELIVTAATFAMTRIKKQAVEVRQVVACAVKASTSRNACKCARMRDVVCVGETG